jgi:DNA helicase HerA-like ATPase
LGGTGDGKSYTIKLFISLLQGEYSIAAYDVDFARDDYQATVEVKYEYSDIENAFQSDITELEQRIGERRELGSKYIPEKRLIIGEEMPALAEECDSLGTWIRKMSKRGRKVGMFIGAVAQNDTAENFALKGDASILKI